MPWTDLLSGGAFAEAACVTWVRGLSPEDALLRFGGTAPFAPRTLVEVDQETGKLYDDVPTGHEPTGLVADRIGDWTLIVEPNGWAASVEPIRAALSTATESITLFWNVNGLAEIAVARGAAVATIHEVIDFVRGSDPAPLRSLADVQGPEPHIVADLVAELGAQSGYAWLPVALRWAERYTKTTLPAGWLQAAHPSAVFPRRR